MGNADDQRSWGLFEPGNVGSYPGRVEKVLPGALDQEILDVRGTDDRGVSMVTVSLAAKVQHTNIDTLRAAFARIQYGISGGRDEVLVDYLHGQMLSIPATFVRVTATYPIGNVNPPGWPAFTPDPETFGKPGDPLVDPVAGELESLILGANIAPQIHPNSSFGSTPRLTIFAFAEGGTVMAPAFTPFIRVPPHAQSVTILCNSATAPPSLIAAHSLPTAASALYSEPNPDVNNDSNSAFPVARGVEYVRLTNTDTQEMLVLLLWTIGL